MNFTLLVYFSEFLIPVCFVWVKALFELFVRNGLFGWFVSLIYVVLLIDCVVTFGFFIMFSVFVV